MDIYSQIAVKIVQGQEAIIGPVAVEQAQRVSDLNLDWSKHEAHVEGNKVQVLNSLIQVYRQLFGQISVEVSRQAASSLISQLPAEGLPEVLKR